MQSAQPATTGRVVATITTLEGTVHMPGIQIELRDPDERIVIAKTETDGAGQVTFPDVPIGRYLITASGPGFVDRDSTVFVVRANETAQVILDAQLTFVLPGVQVRADTPSPTDSVQPVSMSDMLSGSLFETAPLEGDDFRSLLPLLPGVVRDGNGRLRIKGGQPTQGALQISSASLVDPSTGDFDLDLPTQAIDSVEVMANPFAAEYGRFSTQHHADPHQRRHQRLGLLDRQPGTAASRICAASAASSRGHRSAARFGRTASSSRRISSSATWPLR